MITSAFWAGLGAQLRRPHGLCGRITGHAMRLANARANRLAVKALALREGEHVVELGCGPGEALHRLLAQGAARATGIDHSPEMIDQAARRNAGALAQGRLILCCGDFASLPMEDAGMDAVLAVNVAYFMLDAQAITEARRVLKPGGRLVLYVTSADAMRNWRFAGPHSHRLFGDQELRGLLLAGGFRDEDISLEPVDAGFGIRGYIAVARQQM